jgi:beta-lactam-binding protein with PASTA domain/predicted Ser/Thr protein kinase
LSGEIAADERGVVTDDRRRVLGDRYEVEGVLGQGGMAKVFKGHDKVLGRPVAVKVLSPQFAGDDQFVARFRREAQAAAGLNHPNIVSVFDTGSQQDVHYIVMEYVRGRTLRDTIRSEGPILPERAAEIADAVARALGSAHEAGLVHRDIKPGNIMLTSDGEVKVMDFGIARTATGDTLTQTAAVLGTASYLSPEQAQGQSVDGRSDIYSLGCVLYEMVAGRPPFTGDSPVSIAYKHVKEDPVPPSRINPDVPKDLENVIMKAMAKNPANRYQSADEMRQDLERLLQGLPTLATPVLGETTEHISRTRPEGTAVMTQVPPEEEEEERRRRVWLIVLVSLLVLGLIGLAAFFLVRSLLDPGAEPITMPDVVGEQEDDAVQLLESRGLQVNVENETHPTAPRGEVFDQNPDAGQQVEEGAEVTITVSRGPPKAGVPDVINQSEESARAELDAAGFGMVVTGEEPSSEIPEGNVISQVPAPETKLAEGSDVNVVISTGPAQVTVPDVVCDPISDARSEIIDAGLSPQEGGSEFSEECPEGTVARQDPGPNQQVEAGSTVTYYRSKGPEPTPEPTETITTP